MASVDSKFNVSINVSIVKADSGDKFFDNGLTYSNMGYDDVVQLEKMLLGFLGTLTAEGERRAAEAKAKGHLKA